MNVKFLSIFRSFISLAAIISFINLPASAQVRVGIFGDLHGDQEIAVSVLEAMKRQSVSHVIGTGDFVRFEGPTKLEEILSLISPITGVPKQKIWLFPGNWEHETGFTADEMNAIIKRFGPRRTRPSKSLPTLM